MTRVHPTAKAIHAALIRRDRLARDLAALDAAIVTAGREWSRAQGNIMPLRSEALRRSVAEACEAEERERAGRAAASA